MLKNITYIKSGLLIGIILCWSLSLNGQTPYFKTIIFNRENPNLKINTIFKDHEGFLYIGTSEGVYKSDGIDEVLYQSNRGADEVLSIAEDETGTIWVGCRFGKVYTISSGVISIPFRKKISENNITSICTLKDSSVLIGTGGDGILQYKNGSLTNIGNDKGLPDNYIYAITKDVNEKVWIGTDNGIAIYKSDDFSKPVKLLSQASGMPDNIARTIFQDKKNAMWVGFQDNGACYIDLSNYKVTVPEVFKKWKYGQVNDLIAYNNDVWIATEERGLVNCNIKNINQTKCYESVNNDDLNSVEKLCYDNEGNIWLASNLGLIRTHGNWLSFLRKIDGTTITNVHSILCDNRNHIWFTPDMQLVEYNPNADSANSYAKYYVTPKDKHINIVTMREDKYGYIWLGTLGSGILRFDPVTHKKQHITGNADIDNASVLAIEIVNDTLWVATYGGVMRCALDADYNMRDELNLKFEDFNRQPELGNFYINDIFVDSKHRVWFGTDGKGITCYENYKFKTYNEKNGLKASTIYSITEDKKGNIWFSTLGEGVYRFDGKVFKNYSTADGVREMTIPILISDRSGRIIMVHRRGFDIINVITGVFEYYGADNNLSNINVDLNSVTEDKNGNYWIGTEKGIVVFNPNYLHKQHGSKIILKNVLKNGLAFDYSTINNFKYDQYSFTFEFAGLWFTDAYRVKYQYMLEGYNRNWISTKDKSITFPNLTPGTYVFKVQSSLNQKFEHAPIATYTFTIQKPFWRESWFVALVIIAVLVLGYFYVKGRDARIRRLQILENEKINFQLETLKSQVNPHFLFNSFNTLITIIEKDQDDAVEYVENLSQFFRNMVFYRDKDLITLEEEINITDSYYFLQRKRYKENMVIEIIASQSEKTKYCVAPLTLQMLVENAVKHNAVSKETPLTIKITIENERLRVINNINAKIKKETSSGLGLQNISSRYKLLSNKDITVENNGQFFIVTIPLIPIS